MREGEGSESKGGESLSAFRAWGPFRGLAEPGLVLDCTPDRAAVDGAPLPSVGSDCSFQTTVFE